MGILEGAGEKKLSQNMFENTPPSSTSLGEGLLGGASVLNAGTNIYGAFWGVKQGNKAIDLQKEQLNLAKAQYADEKARFDKRQNEIDEFNQQSAAAGAQFSENIAKQQQNMPVNRI